jgi:hypothetical protein
MDGNVLAERKQTHAMPRRDGKSLVIAFYPLELVTPLYGLFGGGIDTAGVLTEVYCEFNQ